MTSVPGVTAQNANALGYDLRRPLTVQELPEEGIRYQEVLDDAFVTQLLGEAGSRGEVRFNPSSEKVSSVDIEVRPLTTEDPPAIRISGHIRTSLHTICVRCLEPVSPQIDAPVEATLYPKHDPLEGIGTGQTSTHPDDHRLEAWDDSFPEPADLAEDAYDGHSIPLISVLEQALLLELPSDPACVDKQACDARTQKLLDAANADSKASDAEGDPRWAALKALRNQLEPSDDSNSGNH